jgi:hypothetical protein
MSSTGFEAALQFGKDGSRFERVERHFRFEQEPWVDDTRGRQAGSVRSGAGPRADIDRSERESPSKAIPILPRQVFEFVIF